MANHVRNNIAQCSWNLKGSIRLLGAPDNCGKVGESSLLVSSSSSLSSSSEHVSEAWMLSVHVEVTLQNSLLKGIRLWSFRLSGRLLDRRSLGRRLRHLRNRFRPVVNGAPGWGGGGEREGSPRSTDDGTLGTRPKLLGPVETLLVWARNIIVRCGSWVFGVACLCDRRSEAGATSGRQSCREARPLAGGANERRLPTTWDGAPVLRSRRRGWVITIARASVWANVAHVRSAKAHSSNEWCCGCSLGVHVVIFDGILINRV